MKLHVLEDLRHGGMALSAAIGGTLTFLNSLISSVLALGVMLASPHTNAICDSDSLFGERYVLTQFKE